MFLSGVMDGWSVGESEGLLLARFPIGCILHVQIVPLFSFNFYTIYVNIKVLFLIFEIELLFYIILKF